MIRENLAVVRGKIEAAAARAGRPAGAVTLVAVTKGVAAPLVAETVREGALHLGESKVQEAAAKRLSVEKLLGRIERPVHWHMVGHLQTNKVRDAVRIFDLIHSVDSVRLAREIDRQAARLGKTQEILLQVNLAAEKSKSGFAASESLRAFKEVQGLGSLRVAGLMTIAPLAAGMDQARGCFRALRQLRDDIEQAAGGSLPELSMGMTDDFEAAVEEGATMVRVGRAIFGERQA